MGRGIKDWSTTAADNDSADGIINWQEGQAPSTVNNSARAMMKRLREWYEDADWLDFGHTLSMFSSTKFTVGSGDRKAIYAANRRIKAVSKVGGSDATIYGAINAVTFSSETAVTVDWDSGSLSSTISLAAVGIINPLNDSLPSSGGLVLSDSSVTTVKIVNDAVTKPKLADNSVGNAELSNSAVGAAELKSGAVTEAKIATDAVTSPKIAANAVGASELSDSSVATANIQNNAVTKAKMATASVGSDELSNSGVPLTKLAATGTRSSSTFLRGDDTFAAPASGDFTTGDALLFSQAIPSGWTAANDHDNVALRLVGTGGTIGNTGGTDSWTTVFSSSKATEGHVLDVSEMPAHTHSLSPQRDAGAGTATNQSAESPSSGGVKVTSSTGGDGSHAHDITMDLNYVDIQEATKN